MTVSVERCEYDDVAQFKSRAARENAAVKPSANTWWFRVVSDGKTVGCAGILWRDAGLVRFKAIYLEPEYRGKGIGSQLYQTIVDAAMDEGASAGEAYAHDARWWLRHGFQVIGYRANGSPHVQRRF